MKQTENKEKKKTYPLLPYLIGLFITVIVIVLLSYLVELRNNRELASYTPQFSITESTIIAV
ncbi:MAG: hypothetical protein KBI01_00930 [Oscillospiraceae bacterium]|nr:hypothetical protein [Oscillospiraceae bacterium]